MEWENLPEINLKNIGIFFIIFGIFIVVITTVSVMVFTKDWYDWEKYLILIGIAMSIVGFLLIKLKRED